MDPRHTWVAPHKELRQHWPWVGTAFGGARVWAPTCLQTFFFLLQTLNFKKNFKGIKIKDLGPKEPSFGTRYLRAVGPEGIVPWVAVSQTPSVLGVPRGALGHRGPVWHMVDALRKARASRQLRTISCIFKPNS